MVCAQTSLDQALNTVAGLAFSGLQQIDKHCRFAARSEAKQRRNAADTAYLDVPLSDPILEHGPIDNARPKLRLGLLNLAKDVSLALELLCSAIKGGRWTAWSSSWEEGWAAIIRAAQRDVQAAFTKPATISTEDSRLSIWRFWDLRQAISTQAAAVLNEQALGQLRRRLPETIYALTRQQWYSRQENRSILKQDDLGALSQAIKKAFLQILSEEVVAALQQSIGPLMQQPWWSALRWPRGVLSWRHASPSWLLLERSLTSSSCDVHVLHLQMHW